MNEHERKALKNRCRWLVGHGPRTPAGMLREVAEWCEAQGVTFDHYGSGGMIEEFEAKVADRLGFEAARFMPSGTMIQLIALRLWCERSKTLHFGMHPTSHLELHEERGYAHLHGLAATLVGPALSPMLAEHFAAVPEPLGALLVELPIREAGGQLPSWDELAALKRAARAADTPLHLDGARLWECAPFYRKSYRDICAGFDSAYVSFYKGIGALPGAMLLGPADLVAEAALWQRRQGGTLYTQAPHLASAAMRIEARLAAMESHYQRAQRVADVLREIEGVTLRPDPPHVNMMHVFLPGTPESLHEARDAFAERTGVWLFGGAVSAEVPGHCKVELSIGVGAASVTDDEVAEGFRALLTS